MTGRRNLKMIKLTKQIESLEAIIEKINDRIYELQDKKDAIEDKACDEDRDLTTREQDRFDKYDSEIDDLLYEIECVENALAFLKDCED